MSDMLKSITFLFLFSLVVSCNKDRTSDIEPSKGDIALSFKIGGYIDAQASTNNSTGNDNIKIYSKTSKLEGLDIESNFIESSDEDDYGIKNKLNKREKSANTPLNSTSKYRLIIFESLSKKLIFNNIVGSNVVTSVPVVRNMEYDWVAFTYNNELDGDLQDPVVISNNIVQSIQVQTARNKPFMAAKGNKVKIVSTDPGNVQSNISIYFKQKTARIAIKLDVKQLEFPARIRTARIILENNKLYTGKYDFLNGSEGRYLPNGYNAYNTYSSLSSPTYPSGNLIVFPTGPGDNNTVYDEATSGYLYTSKLDAFGDISLEARYMDWNYITGSGNPMHYLTYNANFPYETTFDFSIPTPLEFAKSYKFELKFKKGNSTKVSNIWWANFNLAYNPSSGYFIKDSHVPLDGITRNSSGNNKGYGTINTIDPPEKIPSSWNQTANKTDYFQPGYLQMNSPGTYDANRDICSEVLPKGTWRLPTEIEYAALINSGSYIYNKSYLGYIAISTTLPSPTAPTNPNGGVVAFHMHGYLTRPSSGNNWNLNRAGLSQDHLMDPPNFIVNIPSGVNTGYDAGEGRYLYKSTTGGFGYISLYSNGTAHNITGVQNGIPTSVNQTTANNQAYSVRCVRDTRP